MTEFLNGDPPLSPEFLHGFLNPPFDLWTPAFSGLHAFSWPQFPVPRFSVRKVGGGPPVPANIGPDFPCLRPFTRQQIQVGNMLHFSLRPQESVPFCNDLSFPLELATCNPSCAGVSDLLDQAGFYPLSLVYSFSPSGLTMLLLPDVVVPFSLLLFLFSF